jgi:hypothetical protein
VVCLGWVVLEGEEGRSDKHEMSESCGFIASVGCLRRQSTRANKCIEDISKCGCRSNEKTLALIS